MNRFVKFFARGVIYRKDKNGKSCGVDEVRRESGIVLDSTEMMGKIFRQCPDLLPCDWVDVETSPVC